VITPVVGHTTCDLDQQRRLIEARNAGAARRALALRSRGPWSHLRRLVRNQLDPPGRGHAHLDLGTRGEDVWRALRY
jgi:hypothetical protein